VSGQNGKKMNERIKEFSLQASNWARDANWSTDPKFGDRRYEDLYNEKLAELIVGECVRVCEGLADNAWGKGEVRQAEQCAEAIKQHFGVDE